MLVSEGKRSNIIADDDGRHGRRKEYSSKKIYIYELKQMLNC